MGTLAYSHCDRISDPRYGCLFDWTTETGHYRFFSLEYNFSGNHHTALQLGCLLIPVTTSVREKHLPLVTATERTRSDTCTRQSVCWYLYESTKLWKLTVLLSRLSTFFSTVCHQHVDRTSPCFQQFLPHFMPTSCSIPNDLTNYRSTGLL